MYVQTVNENSDAGDFAVEKIRSILDKYTSNPIGVRVKFDSCRHLKKVTAKVVAGPVYSVIATDKAANIYEAIDRVAEKIEKQMRRRKKKQIKSEKRNLKLVQFEEFYESPEIDGDVDSNFPMEGGLWKAAH